MADIIVPCQCGYRLRVSEYAIGMTMSCPKCGEPIPVTEENVSEVEDTRPSAQAARQDAAALASEVEHREMPIAPGVAPGVTPGAAPAASQAAAPNLSATHCVRCGAAFRGDWDRFQTPRGPVCNVCAHLASDDETLKPAESGAPTQRTPDVHTDGAYFPAEPVETDEMPAPFGWNPQKFRTGVAVAGCLVVVLAIGVLIFGGGDAPVTPPTAAGPEAEPLPPALETALKGLFMVLNYLVEFLALYILLHARDRLPNDTFWKNVLAIGSIALVIRVVMFGTMMVVRTIAPVFILAGLVPLAVLLITFYLLYEYFGLRFFDLILWLIFRSLAAGMLYWLRLLLVGLIGNAIR